MLDLHLEYLIIDKITIGQIFFKSLLSFLKLSNLLFENKLQCPRPMGGAWLIHANLRDGSCDMQTHHHRRCRLRLLLKILLSLLCPAYHSPQLPLASSLSPSSISLSAYTARCFWLWPTPRRLWLISSFEIPDPFWWLDLAHTGNMAPPMRQESYICILNCISLCSLSINRNIFYFLIVQFLFM